MFLRVWVLGHEILTVQFTILDPIFETEPTYDDVVDEPAGLSWASADPDDSSHLIWHPEAEASDAEG